jgi:Holliday junction resolvase RusA-like endonuclease
MKLTLPIPVGVNHMYKRIARNQVARVPEAAAFSELVYYAVRERLRLGDEPVLPPVRVDVEMVVANKRRHDIDGPIKVLLDALASALGFDDNEVIELSLTKILERGGKPRLEVEVTHVCPMK